MAETYRAVQVSEPGRFDAVERELAHAAPPRADLCESYAVHDDTAGGASEATRGC